MSASSSAAWSVCAGLCLAGCAPSASSAELRSPSHDYPPPPRTTADGEVIGADRKPITDAIRNAQRPPKKPERSK